MTKQVDVLLGESKGIEKKSTATSSSGTKKEGASFFDNILADAKSKTSTSTTTQKETTTSNTTSAGDTTKEAKVASKDTNKNIVQTTEKNSAKNNVQNNEVENKNNSNGVKKDITTPESAEKATVETKKTGGGSLLDRLVVEAKTVLKDENAKVIKEDEKVTPKKENKVSSEKTTNTENVKQTKENAKTNAAEKVVSAESVKKTDVKEDVKVEEKVDVDVDNKIKSADSKESKETTLVKENLTKVTPETVLKNDRDKTEDKKTVNSVVKENIVTAKGETVEVKAELIQDKQQLNSTKENKEANVSQVKNDKAIDTNSDSTNKQNASTLNNTLGQEKKADVHNSVKTVQQDTQTKNSVNENTAKTASDTVLNSLKEEAPLNEETGNKQADKKEVLASDFPKNELNNKTTTAAEVKNQKVAQELAKLNAGQQEKTNISKEALTQDKVNNGVVEQKKEEKLSLIDKLINDTKAKMANTNTNANESATDAKEQKVDKLLNNDVLANIYLSTRAKNMQQNSMETHHKGKQQVLNAKSVADVKEGAKTLDLGLKETSVEVKQNSTTTTSQTNDILDRNLQRMANSQNAIHDDATSLDIYSKKVSKEASKAVLGETVVNLQVSAQNALNITQRIIGARQQMSSMMSDIAREMYTNYKPPVTAFRLNLQPAHLGSIAIMIKSDRESTISISMNMSSSATLDAVTDNQGSLRSALNKTFGDENSFNLDFGMQDDTKNGAQEQGQQGNQSNQQSQRTSTEGLLEAREENKEEMLMNYM